ncbi:MAG: benzoate-CoA ligase family protein [Acidobacteria bacterium]|nr:benzoate-CoA ligase family protein [Acidobacteriota bacterium]
MKEFMQSVELKPWREGFALPDRFNMVTLLLERHLSAGRGGHTAIYYGDARITYSELGDLTNRLGNVFLQLGVEPEQRVLLLLNDSPEFVGAFLAAMKIGAVPVPVHVLATPSDLVYFLNDCRARVAVSGDAFLPGLEAARQQAPFLRHVLVAGQTAGKNLSLAEAIKSSSPSLETFASHKDDVSYWLYTSGTTGLPRGVVHLQHDLVHSIETWGYHVARFTPDDITYCVPRLFFSYGLNNALYLPLYYGAGVVLSPHQQKPGLVLQNLSRYRPTLFFSVPTSYGQILREADEGKWEVDLGSVRHCISAGEALPAPVYERWLRRFGVEIIDGLGSTEAGWIYISNVPGQVKRGSSGRLLPGYRGKIVDENGTELPAGQVGELLICSDSVAAGYWNRHDQTKKIFMGAWMRTGDRFYQDEEGYLFYQGRDDDVLKVGGAWVLPLEVEQCLLEHEAVAECAVVGALDELGLCKPKAFVTLRQGFTAGAELGSALQRFVKERLAPYKYPRWIEFVDELPKTVTGKIQRYKLR